MHSAFFMSPISYVIKSAASLTWCNDIAPSKWKIAGRWYCAYPSIREYAASRDLPVRPVQIDDKNLLGLDLGREVHLQQSTGGRVPEVPGLPVDPASLPNGDCGAGLQRTR